MISKIVVNEWKLLTRERILLIALPLYVLMLVYGVIDGTSWKHFLEASTAKATAMADAGIKSKLAHLDRIEAGEPFTVSEDPRQPAPYARFKGFEMATKPPSPSAAISVGQSDLLPAYLMVQWRHMSKQIKTDEIENPHNLAVGPFDLGFVLIYLYPLLIIALSYNILSSERENGTQVLLLSQPVTVSQFVVGKILLRGALIIGTAAGVSIICLLVLNPDILTEGALWRVLLLAVMLIFYGVFWFGLSVFVNALGHKSSTNALILMASWIGLVLIVPALLSLTAKSLYPLPSRIELVQALRRADEQAAKASGFERPYRADMLRKGEEAALEASYEDFYKQVLPLEMHAEQLAQPVFDRFDSQRDAQQALARRLKYLSPAVLAQVGLNELANHSGENYDDYMAQVDAYQQRWREYFMAAVMENRPLTRAEMEQVPRFTYRPEADGVIARRVVPDVVALLVFAAATWGAGLLLLKGYSAVGRQTGAGASRRRPYGLAAAFSRMR